MALAANINMTTYVTSWSGYGIGNLAYPFDGSYVNQYHSTQTASNQDMQTKANVSNVIAYAFLQVWSPDAKGQKAFNIPENWAGVLHFDDLWGELPSRIAPQYQQWHTMCTTLGNAACSAIQLDGNTQQPVLMQYSTRDVGQMNNFGSFLKLAASDPTLTKIISIGGANLTANNSIAYHSFQTIFLKESTFITSLKSWLTQLHQVDPQFKGIDYDFEPPIDSNGAQLPPSQQTVADYQKLFKLVQDTRAAMNAKGLKNDGYISVTLTAK